MCYVKGSKIVPCEKSKRNKALCARITQKLQTGKTYKIDSGDFDPYYYTVESIEEDSIKVSMTLIHPDVAYRHNICNARAHGTIKLI
ncbi:hypothetical protein Ferp_0550 [Ferroglobus placidus DSM 10642]|uniref:Uncharacterized protein n=1 Tax=Ferroglobus placidus (strain DSM 10642 / AEDII12DO) TaxID=589924 RepID=D3S390_FERPA|nr:hypothetical protein Ferp_0550 [Ferroglobus placidus DSM 10642]